MGRRLRRLNVSIIHQKVSTKEDPTVLLMGVADKASLSHPQHTQPLGIYTQLR